MSSINEVAPYRTFFDTPHRHAFYLLGFSTIITKSLIPPPQDRDVIYGRPHCVFADMLAFPDPQILLQKKMVKSFPHRP